MSLPDKMNDEPTLPNTSKAAAASILTEAPWTRRYLNEICLLLRSPKSDELIKYLFLRANLVALLDTCANEVNLGRQVLAELGHAEPKLLKLFTRHRIVLDSNPVIRKVCVQCIYDLIDNKNCCIYDLIDNNKCDKLTSFNECVKLGDADIKFSVDSTPGKKSSKQVGRQSSAPNLKKPSYLYDKRKEENLGKKSTSLPLELSSMDDLDMHMSSMNMQVILEDDDMIPSPSRTALKHMMSEDLVPDINKSKGSSSWFIQKPGKVAEKNLNALNIGMGSDSESDERNNLLSPSDQEKQEEEWLESIRGSKLSINSGINPGIRPSILKSASSLYSKQSLSESDQPYRVPDTPKTAFMYKLGEFGVLTALSDLATLDPQPDNCELAERTLQLIIQRAPDNLLPQLPRKFGKFSRVSRRLKLRSASRPIYLNRSTRSLMRDLYCGLVGRTLVLGGGSGVYAEKLMSYFNCHCRSNAKELIVSVFNDTITHLGYYPGFADIYHKLSHCSNVNFDDGHEEKLFDPGDIPNVLANAVKAKTDTSISTKVLFGVDPTKVGSDERFKDSQFNNVFWYFPQVYEGNAALSNTSLTKIESTKDMVVNFLDSVVDILDDRGCIHIALDDSDHGEKWDLNEVAKEASFNIVGTKELPSHLYRGPEQVDRDNRFSKATIYVLKVLGLGPAELSEADSFSDDTYSETSSSENNA